MTIILEIGYAFAVYRGTALLVAEELERIDKFLTYGCGQGHEPALHREGAVVERSPIDIFDIRRVHSKKPAFGKFSRHIPSSRRRGSNDHNLGSTVLEFQEP